MCGHRASLAKHKILENGWRWIFGDSCDEKKENIPFVIFFFIWIASWKNIDQILKIYY